MKAKNLHSMKRSERMMSWSVGMTEEAFRICTVFWVFGTSVADVVRHIQSADWTFGFWGVTVWMIRPVELWWWQSAICGQPGEGRLGEIECVKMA